MGGPQPSSLDDEDAGATRLVDTGRAFIAQHSPDECSVGAAAMATTSRLRRAAGLSPAR